MGATVDILNPERPKRIAIVASNPAISVQTGWPIGLWWSELTHPYWEFVEHGYQVDSYGGRKARPAAEKSESVVSHTKLASLEVTKWR